MGAKKISEEVKKQIIQEYHAIPMCGSRKQPGAIAALAKKYGVVKTMLYVYVGNYGGMEGAKARTTVWRRNNPMSRMFSRAKERAAKRGIEFTIVFEDLIKVKHCPVFGVEIVYDYIRDKNGKHTKDLDNVASLDRKDPSKGYVPGNVWIMSHRANRIKSDATLEELELMVKALKNG